MSASPAEVAVAVDTEPAVTALKFVQLDMARRQANRLGQAFAAFLKSAPGSASERHAGALLAAAAGEFTTAWKAVES